MNTPTRTTSDTQALTAQAARIDELATKAAEVFGAGQGISHALALGAAMRDLRAALTLEIMRPIMDLMNSKLGFDTDRNPARAKPGQKVEPYDWTVVRDITAEALLRGFHMVGNEVNIIAGGFYPAKNGLKRKCEQWPGVKGFSVSLGVPKVLAGGAIVPCRASWVRNGVKDELEAEIPVKFYDNQGADLILGKAERKLYKRVHDRLSGRPLDDADLDDAPAIPENTGQVSQTKTDEQQKKVIILDKGEVSTTETPLPNIGEQLPTQVPVSKSGTVTERVIQQADADAEVLAKAERLRQAKAPPPKLATPEPAVSSSQERLAKAAIEHGVNFERFRAWAALFKPNADSWATWADIPARTVDIWLLNGEELWTTVEQTLREQGKA